MAIIALARRYGGVDVRVLAIAHALEGRQRYGVAVLRNSPLHRKLAEEGLNAIPLPFSKVDPRLFWALRQTLRRGRYGVVDAHNPVSQFWGLLAATACHVPVRIATIHGDWRQSPGGCKGWLYEQILRMGSWTGCYFIAVCSTVLDGLKRLGVADGMRCLIHNSIDAPVPDGANRSMREEFGWGLEDFVVTVVGRLDKAKGHEFLLRALGGVVKRYPQIRCLIVGEGPMRSGLVSLVEALRLREHVLFTGFREDVHKILRGTDVFCLPSITEGLPFALLEASLLGVPSIISNVGGMGELFRHQETAWLTPPADVTALTTALGWFVQNESESAALGRAARKLVEDRLPADDMISRTLSCYRNQVRS